MNLLECPFGSSRHVFPDHFTFFQYCGSKLVNDKETKKKHFESQSFCK